MVVQKREGHGAAFMQRRKGRSKGELWVAGGGPRSLAPSRSLVSYPHGLLQGPVAQFCFVVDGFIWFKKGQIRKFLQEFQDVIE